MCTPSPTARPLREWYMCVCVFMCVCVSMCVCVCTVKACACVCVFFVIVCACVFVCVWLQDTASSYVPLVYCNDCNTLQHAAANCNTVFRYTATHHNALQHTATHCITIQTYPHQQSTGNKINADAL